MARKPKTNVNQMVNRDGESYRPRRTSERDAAWTSHIATIERWVGGWPAVARALMQIRDDHLWTDHGYQSWNEFLVSHFPFARSTAYELLEAERPLRLTQGVRNPDTNPPPVSQMRELNKIEDDEAIPHHWENIQEEAASREQTVTAESVREYVSKVVPPKVKSTLNKGEKLVKRQPANRAVCPTCKGDGYLETSSGAFG